MIGRKAIVGLSLLSALLFCALAAQGASAAESNNTTAFTCVKGGGSLDFSDEHCDEAVSPKSGQFGHEVIPAGKTEIEITNNKTAEKTTKASTLTLKATLGGVETHTNCETVSGSGSIENGGTGSEHKVSGSTTIEVSKCKVEKPANCTVIEPIIWKLKFTGVEKLNGAEQGMGLEFVPSEGKNFTEITLQGAKCGCKGTWAVSGSVIGTGAPNPKEKYSGATWKFAPGNEMEKLTWGEKAVEFSAALTPRMKTGENPISLTTPT